MPRAWICIDDEPQGVAIQIGGTYVPGDDSNVEKMANAAVAAIDAFMQERVASGEVGPSQVSGDPRAIANSVYAERTFSIGDIIEI